MTCGTCRTLFQKNTSRPHPFTSINSSANHSRGGAGPRRIWQRRQAAETTYNQLSSDWHVQVIFRFMYRKISTNLQIQNMFTSVHHPRAFCLTSSSCKGSWESWSCGLSQSVWIYTLDQVTAPSTNLWLREFIIRKKKCCSEGQRSPTVSQRARRWESSNQRASDRKLQVTKDSYKEEAQVSQEAAARFLSRFRDPNTPDTWPKRVRNVPLPSCTTRRSPDYSRWKITCRFHEVFRLLITSFINI